MRERVIEVVKLLSENAGMTKRKAHSVLMSLGWKITTVPGGHYYVSPDGQGYKTSDGFDPIAVAQNGGEFSSGGAPQDANTSSAGTQTTNQTTS